MALGDPYISLQELKSHLKITDAEDDVELETARQTASRGIERHTHRQFNKTETATPRLYRPRTPRAVDVDDFHTTTGLVVETDSTGNGTFDTTWATADYELEPLNGVVGGEPGWPFHELRAVGSLLFPKDRRASVRVTAQWGWDSVPSPVKEAALLVAAEVFKLKDAPFGVAGFGEFGVVRVRENPIVMRMLAKYVLDPVLVG